MSPTIYVVLVDFLQARNFFMGFAFRSFSAKRNVQQHHHGRISSFLSACPIVSCADVDCYVSGTCNDDLCALFGWFGRRQMAAIQFRSFSPCFFVLLRVFAALSLVRSVSGPPKCIRSFVSSMRYVYCVVSGRFRCLAVVLARKVVRTDRPRSANHSYDAFTDPKMHPILRFIHSECFLHYFWPFIVAWLSFWVARFVRTDRPRSANHSYDAFTDPKMHTILRFIHSSCFLCSFWPFVVAWLSFWVARFVRTEDRPRSANHSYDAFTDPKMHTILRFIHSLCFLRCFWPFVVAWLSFWVARFVRTDRPRPAMFSAFARLLIVIHVRGAAALAI
jgi:hypothetical protein